LEINTKLSKRKECATGGPMEPGGTVQWPDSTKAPCRTGGCSAGLGKLGWNTVSETSDLQPVDQQPLTLWECIVIMVISLTNWSAQFLQYSVRTRRDEHILCLEIWYNKNPRWETTGMKQFTVRLHISYVNTASPK
jgi:hypothetical protein